MRSILLSIKPQHVANILNGVKTIEIRKKFPKNYTGWVYIYCTKQGGKYWRRNEIPYEDDILIENGKVVARFWCDKIENLMKYACVFKDQHFYDLLKCACLNTHQLQNYLGNNTKSAYAIHISQLEIFNEPKELNEFGCKRAPQNYCYIEEEQNDFTEFVDTIEYGG